MNYKKNMKKKASNRKRIQILYHKKLDILMNRLVVKTMIINVFCF